MVVLSALMIVHLLEVFAVYKASNYNCCGFLIAPTTIILPVQLNELQVQFIISHLFKNLKVDC